MELDLKKPLMVVDYLMEHETGEFYIYDYAKEIGIKVDEDNPYKSFNHVDKHEIFPPKNDFAFCWATGKFVSINEMQMFINKAKEKGATHLDIHFHADHGNYNLHALQFRMATEKELEKLSKIRDKEKAKQLNAIDEQINKLNKEKVRINGLK